MADYIYLLETRLSAAQRSALQAVREVARLKGQTVFLVGGAVRDLTSGSPVRDLDVVIQGNALKLRKDLERAGAVVAGEVEAGQALFLRFPGGVRVEVGSTLSATYPKPGKPVMRPAGIQEDLRRRDFTANAMALSLNEGSYGLLIDPLNGAADIENRELRLVSNYGFIEEPVRMIRAARLMARLGWTLEEKTRVRYETGKEEGYVGTLSNFHRGYELEEIVHEEDPLRIMRRLEAEGWMDSLSPSWSSAKVNEGELERLRDLMAQLDGQGIRTSGAAAMFPLLTAKLSTEEAKALKAAFPRPGFVAEVDALEGETRDFAALLGGKAAGQASDAWKLITAASPDVVLWAAFSSKQPSVQARFKSFFHEWPQVRGRMPYALLAEMRITPDLPEYEALLERLFFELMDGRLDTPEEMKAFLEPYSPPAPPPVVSLRRPRASKKEGKGKGRAKAAKVVDADEDLGDEGEGSSDAESEDRDEVEPVASTSPESARAAEEEDTADPDEASVSQTPAASPVPSRERRGKAGSSAETTATAALAKVAQPSTDSDFPADALKQPVPASPKPEARPAPTRKVAVPAAVAPLKTIASKSAAQGGKSGAPLAPAKAAVPVPLRGSAAKSQPGVKQTAPPAKPVSSAGKAAAAKPVKAAAGRSVPAGKAVRGQVAARSSKTAAPSRSTAKVASKKSSPLKSVAGKTPSRPKPLSASKQTAKRLSAAASPAKGMKRAAVPAKAVKKPARSAPPAAKKTAPVKSRPAKKAPGRGR